MTQLDPARPDPDATRRDPVLSADVIGGVTTFFTMAYIVVVNPAFWPRPEQGCRSRAC
jgi:hypothetical protein